MKPNIVCEFCNKSYKSITWYNNHKCVPKEVPLDITCDDCNIVFKSQSRYDNHKCKDHSKCTFCNKTVKDIVSHSCRLKDRYLNRDTLNARIAFNSYKIFWSISYNRKLPDNDSFDKSPLYNDFVKFADFTIKTNIYKPDEYVKYLVKNQIKLVEWTKEQLYLKYVRTVVRTESYDRAIERSIIFMDKIAQTNNIKINDFFNHVSPSDIIIWLETGRVSPWVLFNCESGRNLINSFDTEQINIMENIVDYRYWKLKFKKNPDDVSVIQDFLKEEGL